MTGSVDEDELSRIVKLSDTCTEWLRKLRLKKMQGATCCQTVDRPSLAICPISWGQSNITTSNSAPSFLARRALGSGSDGTYIITESSSHFQILLCALFVVVAVVAVSGTPASDSEGGDVSNNVEDESSQENLALLVS